MSADQVAALQGKLAEVKARQDEMAAKQNALYKLLQWGIGVLALQALTLAFFLGMEVQEQNTLVEDVAKLEAVFYPPNSSSRLPVRAN